MASRKSGKPAPEDVLRTLEMEGGLRPGRASGRTGGPFVVTAYDAGGEELERRRYKSHAEAMRAAQAFSEDHAGEGLFALVSPHEARRR
jgi:hypothetical protein